MATKKKRWDALSKYQDGPVYYIWIGTVDSDGEDVQAVRVAQYLNSVYISHFNVGLEKGTRWRFREGTNTVFWWDNVPTATQKEAVSYYLEKRKFYPSHNHLIGDREWPTAHARNEKIPGKYQYKTIGDSCKLMSFKMFVESKDFIAAAYAYRGKYFLGPSHPQVLEDMIQRGIFKGITSWEEFDRKFPSEEVAVKRLGLRRGFFTKDRFIEDLDHETSSENYPFLYRWAVKKFRDEREKVFGKRKNLNVLGLKPAWPT